MPQEHSFDFVSKVNLQEARNAIQQAQKEIGTRFDFRGSRASAEFDESALTMKISGDHQAQLNSVREVVEGKLSRRGISLKSLSWGPTEQSSIGAMKQAGTLQQGLPSDKAKEIAKAIRDLGLKVQARQEGDTVRVVSKQLDELQAVIRAITAKDFGLPLQTENSR